MAKNSTDPVSLAENNESDNLMAMRDPQCAMRADENLTDVKTETPPRSCTTQRLTVALILILSIACLIIGITLISISRSDSKCPEKASTATSNPQAGNVSQFCDPSPEALRVQLRDFLKKVQNTYFKLYPNAFFFRMDATSESIRREFRASIPTPSELKRKTDAALELFREIDEKDIDQAKLKLREKKGISQIRFYLKTVFGQPYEANYYNGDWMLGPNFFCWQPICVLKYEILSNLHVLAPRNLSEIPAFQDVLQSYKMSVMQYISNIKFGVKAGMVGSVEECKAGIDALKAVYREVYTNGKIGILQEDFVIKVLQPSFLSKLTPEMWASWSKQNKRTVEESVKEMLVKNLGLPLKLLFNYLENQHLRHCVPSNVSSGLATRPLSFVYVDGFPNKSSPTTKRLPTGELIQGNMSYTNILPYFTSSDITPDEIYRKGQEMVSKTYSQIRAIAKEITGKSDEKQAVDELKRRLSAQDMYFNDSPIPANESGPGAYARCSTIPGAKRFCPKRWEALQKWFKVSREVMSLLDPKTQNMFYFTAPKVSTPNCPISVRPDFNPSSAAYSYVSSDEMCSESCKYMVPFFLDNMGPVYSEVSTNAHEARPGHHTQVQGFLEHFLEPCGGVMAWINSATQVTAFAEGWGLYAESLILDDTDVYTGNLLMKYGALKWQIWRALRLLVDSGLHYKNMTRTQALQLFADYAWDTTDLAYKEVTRYQSGPGQATAYMIGQLTIQKLRRNAEKKLGESFNLKEFHYQVLSQGSAPLSYLTAHIEEYIECRLKPSKPGCTVILDPPLTGNVGAKAQMVTSQFRFSYPQRRYN